MILSLTPAYGKDYQSEKEVRAAWSQGVDFQVQPQGCYCSSRDIEALQAEGVRWLNIRYRNLSRVAVVKLGAFS